MDCSFEHPENQAAVLWGLTSLNDSSKTTVVKDELTELIHVGLVQVGEFVTFSPLHTFVTVCPLKSSPEA